MPEYIVTYTSMVIEADSPEDAILRAEQSSGGHWEATEKAARENSVPVTHNGRVITVTSTTGVRFNVRVLKPGDGYGQFGHGPLVWGAEGYQGDRFGVEFFDTRYPHTEFGQFTGGRYYLDTLVDGGNTGGLCLDGGTPAWSIDKAAMDIVRAWLREVRDHG